MCDLTSLHRPEKSGARSQESELTSEFGACAIFCNRTLVVVTVKSGRDITSGNRG